MSHPSGTVRCTNCGANLASQPPRASLTRADIFWGVFLAMFVWSLIAAAATFVVWALFLSQA